MKRAYIEISNACNLRCSFCPSPGLSTQREWMSLPLFETVLDQLEGMVTEVYLHVLGEPLLHPLLPDFLAACEVKGMRVNLTTNGVLIGDCSPILRQSPALRQINFSLHALQEISDIRKANQIFDEIIEFAKETAYGRPDVFINFRLWNNGSQTESERAWNTQVYERLCRAFDRALDLVAFDAGKRIELGGRMCLHQEKQFEWPADVAKPSARDRGTCQGLKSHCAVLVDGRVIPCCLDYRGDLTLGHVLRGGIAAALSSDRARAMRAGFDRKMLVEPFCQQCTFCDRFG